MFLGSAAHEIEMTRIHVDGLTMTYPGATTPAIEGLHLNAPSGRITAIVGPSGSGKSTLLRLVAGLERPDSGSIRFDQRDVLHVPAERREAAMMFQQPLLLPHMSVAENVAFGLRARGVARPERLRESQRMLGLVHMEGFGDRSPSTLSGGQAQRVALARALVIRPKLMLLDEPLSSLDVGLRGDLRTLVQELQRTTGITTVLVTHDLEEALAMADHLAVMIDGTVRQAGDPRDVYACPIDAACARILGVTNVLPGVKQADRVETPVGSLPCDPIGLPDGLVNVIIRSEHVQIEAYDGGYAEQQEAQNAPRGALPRSAQRPYEVLLSGRVIESSFHGARERLIIGLGESRFEITRGGWPSRPLTAGESVRVTIPRAAIRLVPSSSRDSTS